VARAHHTVFAFSKLPDSVSFSFLIRSRTSVGELAVLFACVIVPAKKNKVVINSQLWLSDPQPFNDACSNGCAYAGSLRSGSCVTHEPDDSHVSNQPDSTVPSFLVPVVSRPMVIPIDRQERFIDLWRLLEIETRWHASSTLSFGILGTTPKPSPSCRIFEA
jgi:hypothetical protein